MPRRQVRDKTDETNSCSDTKYTNEEITSAITLASIMKEGFEQTETQALDVITDDDCHQIKDKESVQTVNIVIANNTSPPKSSDGENGKTQKMIESDVKPSSVTYTTLTNSFHQPISASYHHPIPANHHNQHFLGSPQLDPYGYPYAQYSGYPMYAMPTNYHTMASRQCPYCFVVSPPMAAVPMQSNPGYELPKRMPEHYVSHPMAVPHPQMIPTQIPVSDHYQYYQNGHKAMAAQVQGSETEKF